MNEVEVTLEHAMHLQKIGIATIVKNGQVFIEQDQKY